MNKEINFLFAATSDYLPFVTVTAASIANNIPKNCKINLHFLYADIVKEISNKQRNFLFEAASKSFNDFNITFKTYDVTKYISILKGQNIGMWSENICLTHYMYLLAPLVLKDIPTVIFLDADMIVNCDLSELIDIDMKNYLIAMGAPRGMEEMGDDVSNSGFVVLNLKKWQTENTLESLLRFGKELPKSRFCDQNLLHNYFKIKNPDRLLLLDKNYNIFPQLFTNISIQDIKILHFTGWECIAPWYDCNFEQRASYLWWYYAQRTVFYEYFLIQMIKKYLETSKISIDNSIKGKKLSIDKIFSIKNEKSANIKHKVITIFGIKFKFKVKSK